jgi:hypothetical protein
MRDGQKWVAWWALLVAVCAPLAVEALASRLARAARPAVLVGAVLLPIALMPDLAYGGLGRLSPVEYPREWSAVRHIIATDRQPGDVLVLPTGAFRQFGWNSGRTQLDPAPRFLTRTVVLDDTLLVGNQQVRGDDPRAERVLAAASSGQPLGPLGIGWVLVERGTPGSTDPAELTGLEPVHTGRWLSLFRVPGPVTSVPTPHDRLLPVLLVDILALALVGTAVLRRWLLIGRLMGLWNVAMTGNGDRPGRRWIGGRPRWSDRFRRRRHRVGRDGQLRIRDAQRAGPPSATPDQLRQRDPA